MNRHREILWYKWLGIPRASMSSEESGAGGASRCPYFTALFEDDRPGAVARGIFGRGKPGWTSADYDYIEIMHFLYYRG